MSRYALLLPVATAILLGAPLSPASAVQSCALLLGNYPTTSAQTFCPLRSTPGANITLSPNVTWNGAAAYVGSDFSGSVWYFGGACSGSCTSLNTIRQISLQGSSLTNNAVSAHLASPRYLHTATLLGSAVFVCGGIAGSTQALSTCDIFMPRGEVIVDPDILPSMPAPLACHSAVSLTNQAQRSVLVIVGGLHDLAQPQNQSLTTFAYDPVANNWTTKAPPPVAHMCGGAAVAYNASTLLYCGGTDGTGTPFANCYMYNVNSNVWAPAGSMVKPRHDFSLVQIGGTIYAMGGSTTTGSSHPDSSVEFYDVETQNYKEFVNGVLAMPTLFTTAVPIVLNS